MVAYMEQRANNKNQLFLLMRELDLLDSMFICRLIISKIKVLSQIFP